MGCYCSMRHFWMALEAMYSRSTIRVDDVAIWTKQFLPDALMALPNTTLTSSELNLKYLYKLNHSGSGPGIAVTNTATTTAGQHTGTTVGNVVFSSRNVSGGLTLVQSGFWNDPTT